MITARWLKDVVPGHVAEAQHYWELIQRATRLRDTGLLTTEVGDRFGDLPDRYRYLAYERKSPVYWYLAIPERYQLNPRPEGNPKMTKLINDILADKDLLAEAVKRAQPILDGIAARKAQVAEHRESRRLKANAARRKPR